MDKLRKRLGRTLKRAKADLQNMEEELADWEGEKESLEDWKMSAILLREQIAMVNDLIDNFLKEGANP